MIHVTYTFGIDFENINLMPSPEQRRQIQQVGEDTYRQINSSIRGIYGKVEVQQGGMFQMDYLKDGVTYGVIVSFPASMSDLPGIYMVSVTAMDGDDVVSDHQVTLANDELRGIVAEESINDGMSEVTGAESALSPADIAEILKNIVDAIES